MRLFLADDVVLGQTKTSSGREERITISFTLAVPPGREAYYEGALWHNRVGIELQPLTTLSDFLDAAQALLIEEFDYILLSTYDEIEEAFTKLEAKLATATYGEGDMLKGRL